MDFEPEQLVALTDHGTMTLRFVAKDSQNCGECLSWRHVKAFEFCLPLTREDTMGWFDRLFGRTPERPSILARFKRKVTRRPRDPELLKIAKDRKGHVSRRAVRDEYNRLILEKYADDKA
jgi:hypothetical protein